MKIFTDLQKNYMRKQAIITIGLWLFFSAGMSSYAFGNVLDVVTFGNAQSETEHNLASNRTQIISGALGEPARQCLPLVTPGINGGDFSFTIRVDPVKRNYITVKFWGGDEENRPSANNMGRIYLYAPLDEVNYSVGARHESDYAALSLDGQFKAPLPGRFFYSTTMLPLWMTKGKNSITLKIVSTGRLYGLGSGIAPAGNYQYLMDYPSRGIYKAFSHTEAMLDVSGEVNGTIPAIDNNLAFAGESVLSSGGTLFNRVRDRINNRLTTTATTANFTTPDVQYLAKSYFVEGLPGYQNPQVIKKVVAVIDAYTNDFYSNNNGVSGGGNDGWGGQYGPLGYAIHLLRDELRSWLDVTIGYKGGYKTRREAWGDMLAASRDYGRMNRRGITNQTLIGDGHLYKANKGLLALGDTRAFSEEDAQRYLKEAVGLLPWLGNDLSNGSSAKPYGSNFYMVTQKGLTRERGYLGVSYGEMASHASEFYRITGNEEFRTQAIKMVNARVKFRRPAIQKRGNSYYRAMEGIGLLSWRGARESDGEFSNEIAYGDRYGYTGGLYCAAATGDPDLMAYAQQMADEKQLFASFSELDGRNHLHLDIFSDYRTFKAAQKSDVKIPMSDGEPDFVWADEEIAIIAMKQGENRLWISPYWQQKEGINGVARFHYSTPDYDQYGVLETYPRFQNSGTYTVRKESVDIIASSNLPDNPKHAYAGELLPVPVSELVRLNTDLSGYMPADFYAFRFGKYLFGINTSHTRGAELNMPAGVTSGTELISNVTISGSTVRVDPQSTKVIALSSDTDERQLPTPPLMAYVSSKTSTSAILKWSDASGAETYTVKGAVTSGGPYSPIASGLVSTTYTVSDISQNKYFVIHGVNSHGESYPSTEAALTYLTTSTPAITGSLKVSGKVGANFSYNIPALYSPTAFDAEGLPDGLTINAKNGLISGVPTTAGIYDVKVSAQNSAGSVTGVLVLTIEEASAPRINSQLVVQAYKNVPFCYKIEADNYPVYFSASDLPPRFQIDTHSGIIRGIFTDNGTYSLSVTALNSAGEESKRVTVAVATPPIPEISGETSATALLNEDFKFYIVATYAPATYTATDLPPGFSIDTSTGCISGKATQPGVYTVPVSATNDGGTGKATLTITIPATAPVPWMSQDIFAPGVEISRGYNAYDATTRTFTVNGGGNDIGQQNDSFHFLYCPAGSTNIVFTARLAARKNASGADKVGIMIRETTASNSRHVYLNIDMREKMVRFPFRPNSGGGTDYTQGTVTNGNSVPIWFRLERSGSLFTGYMSLNGTEWEKVGSATISMPQNVLVGMAVCSRNAILNTSSFDNVLIEAEQTISFPDFELKRVGDPDFDPAATATSGLPVSYASAHPKVATVVGNRIHIVGVGTATIVASQSGDDVYKAARNIAKTLTVQEGTSIRNDRYDGIAIYPRLVGDILNIDFGSVDFKKAELTVGDLSGRVLLARNLKSKENRIEMHGLQPGVYIVTLAGENGFMTSIRVIKKNPFI